MKSVNIIYEAWKHVELPDDYDLYNPDIEKVYSLEENVELQTNDYPVEMVFFENDVCVNIE